MRSETMILIGWNHYQGEGNVVILSLQGGKYGPHTPFYGISIVGGIHVYLIKL